MINTLPICCSFKPLGCDVILPVGKIATHEMTCVFAPPESTATRKLQLLWEERCGELYLESADKLYWRNRGASGFGDNKAFSLTTGECKKNNQNTCDALHFI